MGETYRLLLDENLEHEVLERLVDADHDEGEVGTSNSVRRFGASTKMTGVRGILTPRRTMIGLTLLSNLYGHRLRMIPRHTKNQRR